MISTAEGQQVRIFLVGHAEAFSRSLARYVYSDPRVALTGVAPSLALADLLLPAIQADLALVEWSAIKASPRGTLQALRLDCPGLRIVCVANEPEPYRAAATRAGADAVISTNTLAEDLEFLLRDFFPERFAPPAQLGKL